MHTEPATTRKTSSNKKAHQPKSTHSATPSQSSPSNHSQQHPRLPVNSDSRAPSSQCGTQAPRAPTHHDHTFPRKIRAICESDFSPGRARFLVNGGSTRVGGLCQTLDLRASGLGASRLSSGMCAGSARGRLSRGRGGRDYRCWRCRLACRGRGSTPLQGRQVASLESVRRVSWMEMWCREERRANFF